jgi:hypothetical protein
MEYGNNNFKIKYNRNRELLFCIYCIEFALSKITLVIHILYNHQKNIFLDELFDIKAIVLFGIFHVFVLTCFIIEFVLSSTGKIKKNVD